MVRVEDFHACTPGSTPPRHIVIFSFKIQETCTLTTFVEQSLCQETFMRVYVNRERAV